MELMRLKTVITVAIIVVGLSIIPFINFGSNVSAYQASGIVIDFGDMDVTWTDVDLHAYDDPFDALEYACEKNGYDYVLNDDGTPVEINGFTNNEYRTWGFWSISSGSTSWEYISVTDRGMNLLNYTVTAWAYCGVDEKPTVGVDQAGRCIYGYQQAYRTVSLSPSITEIIGSLNAVNTLVGTDKYSSYPESVIEGQNKGDITIVGDYVNPSFEYIMKTNPDMVLCDGSQYTHYEMSERLRKSNVNTILMYFGESIDTIMNNIYIVGVVTGYDLRAQSVISDLKNAMAEMDEYLLQNVKESKSVLFSLSAEKAPWVAGAYTYVDDIVSFVYGNNVYSNFNGWVQTNSEFIARLNPSKIIIITEDYDATQSDYNALISSMSKEWQSTDAYKNGEIYVICESAAEMASHAGPRFAQLMELIMRILHIDIFTDVEMPKYIGSDYEEYLTFTKYLGFGGV